MCHKCKLHCSSLHVFYRRTANISILFIYKRDVHLWLIINWLIDWIVLYAISAIFQPYNGGTALKLVFDILVHLHKMYNWCWCIVKYRHYITATLEMVITYCFHNECINQYSSCSSSLWNFWWGMNCKWYLYL